MATTCVIAASEVRDKLNGSWISGYLSRTVSELTGRQLTIGGELQIDWGLEPQVRVTDVRLDNPDWADQPRMARIDELVLQIDLRGLVRGKIRFPQLKLIGPELWLEVGPQTTNWSFSPAPDTSVSAEVDQALSALHQPETQRAIAERVQGLDPSEVAEAVDTLTPDSADKTDGRDNGFVLPQLDRLLIEDVVVHYANRGANRTFDARIDNASGSLSNDRIRLNAEGDLAGQPLQLALDGGSLTALRIANRPFPVDTRIQIGGSTLRLSGQTDGLVQPSKLSMTLDARLVRPLPLAEGFGFDRPLPSPLELHARLDYGKPLWQLSEFSLGYDESRVNGRLRVDAGGEPLVIDGSVDATTLDLRPFIASGAATEQGPPVDVKQLLAPLEGLKTDLILKVERMLGPNQLELTDLAADLEVREGRLRLAPINLALGGGEARASLQLDAGASEREAPAATLEVDLERVDVKAAARQLGLDMSAPGTLDGSLILSLDELPEQLTLQAALPRLNVDQAQLRYAARSVDTILDLGLSQQDQGLLIAGEGSYKQKPIKLEVKGGRLLSLLGSDAYPIAGELRLGDSLMSLNGEIALASSPPTATLAVYGDRLALSDAQTLRDVELKLDYRDGKLGIGPSTLTYIDKGLNLKLDAEIATHAEKLQIEASGSYRDEPLRVSLTGDPPPALLGGPYKLEARLSIAESEARVKGSIARPLQVQGLDLELALAGPNPARLSRVLGYPLPDLPPYSLKARLAREGEKLRLDKLDGRVGDSDLAGALALDLGASPPRIDADLRSALFDLDDLGGLIGAAPATGPGETASSEQTREARREEKSPYVLPREPLGLARATGKLDGVIKFRGKRVQSVVPLDEVRFVLELNGQSVKLKPVELGVGGGRVTGRVELDTSGAVPKGELEGEVTRVDLRTLLEPFEISDDSLGLVGGRLKFWVSGDSLADLFASADGGLFLLMTGGRLDATLVEVAGLDLGETAVTLFGDQDGGVPIDCAYIDLHAKSGIARLEHALVDTRDTLFVADGFIDFNQELIDLVIDPKPKDFSLFSARAPLHLKGRLADPAIYPGESVWLKLGTAAALGALATPLAALLPLIEPGDNQGSVYCHGLVSDVNRAR